MNRALKRLVLTALMVGFVLEFGNFHLNAQGPQDLPRKIVVFRNNFVNEAAQIALLRDHGATIIKPLRLINAVAVYLPPQAERALHVRGEVLRIDDDIIITAIEQPSILAKGKPKPPQPAEVIPWGVDRIEADKAWGTSTGETIRVAIVDTGIDLDHLDLKDNIKGNVNTINPLKSGNDDNGHGTHVAGTVAAVDNEIGVIGVGPKISLYAVKVLNKSGLGFLSDLIEGIEWCINNNIQVINMSLGSSSDVESFHDAIIEAYKAGVIQVAAAGNNGTTTGLVDYPAKYPETIAVSAVGKNDDGTLYFASFSSYGSEVDLTAPGVKINSTYNNGYYKELNGTSMATPHVAGTAALVIAYKYPLKLTPDEMKAHLKNISNVEDLGLSSYKQGAGLVRADLAVLD